MALSADMMGGGLSAGQAHAIQGSANTAVSAAGTTQGTATALKARTQRARRPPPCAGTSGVVAARRVQPALLAAGQPDRVRRDERQGRRRGRQVPSGRSCSRRNSS